MGMSVGFFLIETSAVTPKIVRDSVAWLGFYLIAAHAFIFLVASVVYTFLALRRAISRKG